ncbi:MAG: hypothetical protein NZ602_05265 [Thermoguttaceae bacterium]|nr:hypothetical protein [Thermoguttaceae bacterium]MDW8038851.1 hypothetical protein [Thermoguttaceae bacterium]
MQSFPDFSKSVEKSPWGIVNFIAPEENKHKEKFVGEYLLA